MRTIDWYLSGIARTAWPQADVTKTRDPAGMIWTDYRLLVEGVLGNAPPVGLGDTFREAKANLMTTVKRGTVTVRR